MGEGDQGYAYVNGTFVDGAEAKISVFDRGFLYGDGVYDTLFARHGFVFKLDAHLARLVHSAKAIHLDLASPIDTIREIVLAVLSRSRLSDAYVKVLASRGVGSAPLLDPRECAPTLVVFARPYTSLAEESKMVTGVRAKIVASRHVPLECWDPRVKSLNYLSFVLAKWEAVSSGFDEALILDKDGFVCEAPGYNVFAVVDDKVRTPKSSVLEGITRETVLELCDQLGIATAEAALAPYDLLNASELFLTSTAGGLVPVQSVDTAPVGSGRPGPVFLRLVEAYDELLRSGLHGTRIPEESCGS